MDLFTHAHETRMRREAPLAARMRHCQCSPGTAPLTSSSASKPTQLADILRPRQAPPPRHPGRPPLLQAVFFTAILLWGPPGNRKTTLAERKRSSCAVIANQTKSHFETLSAVLAGKAELRVVIDTALE